jgi:predicted nucleotidyltransferase component of viral defense system
MKYATATAFRTALESRLSHLPANQQVRLRKEIAFNRVLARLSKADPSRWIVKGGFALDVRFGRDARSTKDLDLFSIHNRSDALETMFALTESHADDFFEFVVRLKKRVTGEQPHNAATFHVSVRLDGRRFEDINIDIEIAEQPSFNIDRLEIMHYLDFAGLEPTAVALISLEQHLAEKIHAYTRQFADGRENTRVKDLVDIVLISQHGPIRGAMLISAIDATFASRNAQPPTNLPPPPSSWSLGYRALALQVNIDPDISTGFEVAQRFLNPILSRSTARHAWDKTKMMWVEVQSDHMAPLG